MNNKVLPIIGITIIIAAVDVVATIAGQSNNSAYANKNSLSVSSSIYDCSKGSDGCEGNVYCDINDRGSCYNRHEGNDDGSSTDPDDPSFNGISNPEPPYYR